VQKLSEYSIIETVEKICNPDLPVGEWIAKQDIVEDRTKLKVSSFLQMLLPPDWSLTNIHFSRPRSFAMLLCSFPQRSPDASLGHCIDAVISSEYW
jgi:hypothetical protein